MSWRVFLNSPIILYSPWCLYKISCPIKNCKQLIGHLSTFANWISFFENKWSNPSTSQGVLRSPWVTHGSESLLTYNIFVILRCCKKIHWLLSKIRYCQNEWRKKIQYFVIFLPNVTQSLCNKSCGKMDYNEYLPSNWG